MKNWSWLLSVLAVVGGIVVGAGGGCYIATIAPAPPTISGEYASLDWSFRWTVLGAGAGLVIGLLAVLVLVSLRSRGNDDEKEL